MDRKKILGEILYKIGFQASSAAKINEDRLALQVAVWDEVLQGIPAEHLNACYVYASKNFDIVVFKPRHMLDAWEFVKERLRTQTPPAKQLSSGYEKCKTFDEVCADTDRLASEIVGEPADEKPAFNRTIAKCVTVRKMVDELISVYGQNISKLPDNPSNPGCEHKIVTQWYRHPDGKDFCEVCTYNLLTKTKKEDEAQYDS